MAGRMPLPEQGEPISAEWGRQLQRWIADLIEDGPEVCAPLAKLRGTIYLDQDYQVYYAKTTTNISGRVGAAWGSGSANFLTVDQYGVESVMLGNPLATVWNPLGGAIGTGIRISLAWTYDKWVILGGDCSGVA
jgi:hypothetical protein